MADNAEAAQALTDAEAPGDPATRIPDELAAIAGMLLDAGPPRRASDVALPPPRPAGRSGSVSSVGTELTALTAATGYTGTTGSSGTLLSFTNVAARFADAPSTSRGFWLQAVRTCVMGGHVDGAGEVSSAYMRKFEGVPLSVSDAVILSRAGKREVSVKMEAVRSLCGAWDCHACGSVVLCILKCMRGVCLV